MNSIKYKFDEFTFEAYRRFLSIAQENYSFVFFDDYRKYQRFILLRHDVDLSISSALKIAELESENNIRSTFLFNLRCSFYNMLDPEELKKIMYIQSLGHQVGIHFDINSYKINEETELISKLKFEKHIFELYLGKEMRVVSFHNPTLSGSFDKEEYAGLINTYSSKLKTVKYCSDSNGYWRFESIFDLVEQKKYYKLHILLHPGHWQEEVMSPKERIDKCINNQAERLRMDYKNLLERNGRELINRE